MRPLCALLLACAAALLTGCPSGGLVGGGCADGLTACGTTCLDLSRDPSNCGACGAACTAGLACVAGACGAPDAGDAGGDDASLDADGANDADATDDGALSDASDEGDATSDGDAALCVPPYDTHDHCGDCATACTGATPLCTPIAGAPTCVAACPAPLEACNGQCYDFANDESHCGACASVCTTGICQGGQCVGAGFGHEVVIGMDFAVAYTGSPPATLLGNAVLLASHDPVRVLAYAEHADASASANVKLLLASTAATHGRVIDVHDAPQALEVATDLSVTSYDVLLVYDQPGAPDGELDATGASWRTAIDGYARAGGVVVVLDGGSGVAQMHRFLTSSGLLAVSGQADATGATLRVSAPADAVGVHTISPFLARRSTVTLDTTAVEDATRFFVVKDSASGLPVVVHAVTIP